MKKTIFIISVVVIAILILFSIFFGKDILRSMPWNKQKATDGAKEYLSQKYQQEMLHIKTKYPPINIFGKGYTVYFAPSDVPEMVFEVVVSGGFKTRKDEIISDKKEYYFSPDNYLFALFGHEANQNLTEISMDIWGDISKGYAIVNNGAQYTFKIPAEINENSSHFEMEQLLNYYVSFDIDLILNSQNKDEEAQKILEVIEIIKSSEYTPNRILFWYKTGNKKKKGSLPYVNTRDRYSIGFENWTEISSVDEILEQMQKQWFDE